MIKKDNKLIIEKPIDNMKEFSSIIPLNINEN